MAVRDGLVSAACNKRADGFHMVGSTVAKNDRFDQRGPPEIVDMVQRCASRDQTLNDFVVAEMRGGDECGFRFYAHRELGVDQCRIRQR